MGSSEFNDHFNSTAELRERERTRLSQSLRPDSASIIASRRGSGLYRQRADVHDEYGIGASGYDAYDIEVYIYAESADDVDASIDEAIMDRLSSFWKARDIFVGWVIEKPALDAYVRVSGIFTTTMVHANVLAVVHDELRRFQRDTVGQVIDPVFGVSRDRYAKPLSNPVAPRWPDDRKIVLGPQVHTIEDDRTHAEREAAEKREAEERAMRVRRLNSEWDEYTQRFRDGARDGMILMAIGGVGFIAVTAWFVWMFITQ